jgi:hypothetical protein
MNALFDINSLKLTAVNRSKLPFEREISNVHLSFHSDTDIFYDDAIQLKLNQLLEEDILTTGFLYGKLESLMDQKRSHVHSGWDFFVFEKGFYLTTLPFSFSTSFTLVRIYFETNKKGLKTFVTTKDGKLHQIDTYNEVQFDTPQMEVTIYIKNDSENIVELKSLGIFI